jgi:hypothetical protein
MEIRITEVSSVGNLVFFKLLFHYTHVEDLGLLLDLVFLGVVAYTSDVFV